MLSLKSVIVLVLLHLNSCAKLPEIFKLCNRNSINLSKCSEDNAKSVLPHLLKGVKELDIAPLINLRVPKIVSPSYASYIFNFEGNISNLEGVTYYDIVFDTDILAGGGKFLFPKLELQGNYTIQGFVGKNPMTGKGPANVTIHNLRLETLWSCDLFRLHGTDYFKVMTASLISYNVSSFSYHFDNLFDRDKIQGESPNQVLNKYWWILAGNFLPHVSVYLTEVIFKTVSKVFANTTFDEVFPSF